MTDRMRCDDVRAHLLDYQRGQLGAGVPAEVHAHLETCAACAHEDAAERALTEVLERRLPQHAAPLALKRRLQREVTAESPAVAVPRPSWWKRQRWMVLPAAAVAAALLAMVPLYEWQRRVDPTPVIREAVIDHLRLLSSQNPLDVRSGGIHQVKPWFGGRLDFAPVVHFGGDSDFPLQGGAVAYFLDRKAAAFVYHRRLHVISLFVFRADGVPWQSRGLTAVGPVQASVTSARGFNVILWRDGDLGYALVSDVDAGELTQLAGKLAGGA